MFNVNNCLLLIQSFRIFYNFMFLKKMLKAEAVSLQKVID